MMVMRVLVHPVMLHHEQEYMWHTA
jgi:hypothetical protein